MGALFEKYSKVSELISKMAFSIDLGIFVSQRYMLSVIEKNCERSAECFKVFEKIRNRFALRFSPVTSRHLPGERDMIVV